MDENGIYLCLLNTKHGNWLFKSKESFCNWQSACLHENIASVHGKHHDYKICERCLRVIEEKVVDHHPDIARYLDDGGAIIEELE